MLAEIYWMYYAKSYFITTEYYVKIGTFKFNAYIQHILFPFENYSEM
jgi:hypothetical protein